MNKLLILISFLISFSIHAASIVNNVNKDLKSEYLIEFVNDMIALELNLELGNGNYYGHKIVRLVKDDKNRVVELTITSHIDYEGFDPEFGDPMTVYEICTSILQKDKNGKYQESLSSVSCVADPEADPNYIDFNDFYGYDQD